MRTTTELTLDELIKHSNSRLDQLYTHYLNDMTAVELKSAMAYTLSNGGKRLRPLLIYATGLIFGASWENLDIPASAVEMIHTYSLIHDDLPCMDNADLRRGKPTCHKVYGEGMAVLTGDALHTLAMQLLASHPATLKPNRRLQMLNVLSAACGPYGMAAGQALDITILSDPHLSDDILNHIYCLKTGALFSACIELGRLASGDEDELNQRALKQFGDYIGLAFQIQDDILDVEAETAILGKQQGIDDQNNKVTYVKRHGVKQSKETVQALYQQALQTIDYLGNQARLLRELTGRILVRQS